MPIEDNDFIRQELSTAQLLTAIENARTILGAIEDRKNLHQRDDLERFNNILMGEIAEQMVIAWLTTNGKQAISAVDKTSRMPDSGHDIWVTDSHGDRRKCSVKSSLSALKTTPADILDTFTIALDAHEIRDLNIQVYFWLDLNATPRASLPALKNAAIVAWCSKKHIDEAQFAAYEGEQRKAPALKLRELKPMHSLLKFLK